MSKTENKCFMRIQRIKEKLPAVETKTTADSRIGSVRERNMP